MKENKSNANINLSEIDLKTLEAIFDFLTEFPNKITKKSKDKETNKQKQTLFIDNPEIRSWVIAKYLKSIETKKYSTTRTTVADELVSIILEKVYGYDPTQRENIQQSYIDQKQVEQKVVGNLLQRYIAKEGYRYGYYDVAGEILRTIDMIKKNNDGTWTSIQIKNSDNTKNSTVSKGTDSEIKKWERRNSRTGQTNWDKFPDEELKLSLSEEGFRKFIWEYFNLDN